MKKEIEINVPMEALLQDPELYWESMCEEYDGISCCQEMKDDMSNKIAPDMFAALAEFMIEPTIERKNAVIIIMDMLRYWHEKEVNI
tara:strand:+ start:147 stop:407 length:261 start_codon:yes stop_codon:yes gene_type:complete